MITINERAGAIVALTEDGELILIETNRHHGFDITTKNATAHLDGITIATIATGADLIELAAALVRLAQDDER